MVLAAGTSEEQLKRASWAAAHQPDQQQEQAGRVPAQDAVDTGTKPASVLSSAAEERNKAPGILDRRKSTRPALAASSRSLSRNNNKSGRAAPPIRISMADIGAAEVSKDDHTPGNESVGLPLVDTSAERTEILICACRTHLKMPQTPRDLPRPNLSKRKARRQMGALRKTGRHLAWPSMVLQRIRRAR